MSNLPTFSFDTIKPIVDHDINYRSYEQPPAPQHGLDPRIRQEWLARLRSGLYQQIIGSMSFGYRNPEARCAMGILADIIRGPRWETRRPERSNERLEADELARVGLTDREQRYIVQLNDGTPESPGRSFLDIARFIESRARP